MISLYGRERIFNLRRKYNLSYGAIVMRLNTEDNMHYFAQLVRGVWNRYQYIASFYLGHSGRKERAIGGRKERTLGVEHPNFIDAKL